VTGGFRSTKGTQRFWIGRVIWVDGLLIVAGLGVLCVFYCTCWDRLDRCWNIYFREISCSYVLEVLYLRNDWLSGRSVAYRFSDFRELVNVVVRMLVICSTFQPFIGVFSRSTTLV
jgi:hypothetical protein